MALERKDRRQDTTTTTGTGTIDLGGSADTGYLPFDFTDGATIRYLIQTDDRSEWEVGEGVFTSGTPNTLLRDTIYASSNAGSAVNFSTGTKKVYCVETAEDVKTQETQYKIVPTVASNNLTVAIKHMDGTNATSARPIYKRIGDTMRKITSALSVTTNAGTNWFNAGSSELATKEIDYFVYLGYNATDGVVIGFSRIPSANSYDDFSATTTNEKYCAISTITNAAATDYYSVIGRFAATLSAGTGYTWAVPTFTAKNLIQRPIFESRMLDAILTFDTSTFDDGAGGQPGLRACKYKIGRSSIIGTINIGGTKVGDGKHFILTSVPFGIASPAYISIGSSYNATSNIPGVFGRRTTDSNSRIVFSETITDNATISCGVSFEYEI